MISNKSIQNIPSWYLNYGNKLFESKENLILEQNESLSIDNLVANANKNDSEEVKGTGGYGEVMAWYSNEGPTKGKSLMSKDEMIECMKYWTGDMSSKTSTSDSRIETALNILANEEKLSKLLNRLDKEWDTMGKSSKSKYGKITWDKTLIVDAAKKLKDAFSKLHKSGKKIGAKSTTLKTGNGEVVKYSAHTTPNLIKYPGRLGIIPFKATSDGIDRYNGKNLSALYFKTFSIWYNNISNDLNGLISNLDPNSEKGSEVIRTKYLSFEDNDKIAILNKFSEKANKRKDKEITGALKVKWWPSVAKTTTNVEKKLVTGEPVTNHESWRFPKDAGISKTFFLDDQHVIDPKFSNSINEFVSDIRQQIPKDAEITSVEVQAVASTSTVPSTRYYNDGGNVKLVKLRLKAINDITTLALAGNNLNENVTYVGGGGLPNQGEQYVRDDEKWGPRGNRNALYEKTFGPHRWSGVEIRVGLKITTQETTETPIATIEVTGKWNSVISWRKPPKPPWDPPRIFNPRPSNGLFPVKGGTDCFDWCAAYG